MEKLLQKRTIGFSLAILIGGGALTGCSSSPEILPNRNAEVVGHEYHSDYTTFILAGKVLVPQYHPEEFHLDVRQCDRQSDEFADEQGCVTAHIDVDESTYNEFQDGDTIVFDE